MALFPRDKTPTPYVEAERIEVSPDQVYQKGPPPKRFWELSFEGHVMHMILISFAIVFFVLASFGAFVIWSLGVRH